MHANIFIYRQSIVNSSISHYIQNLGELSLHNANHKTLFLFPNTDWCNDVSCRLGCTSSTLTPPSSPPANTSMSSSQSLQQSVLTFLLSSTHTGTTDWWHFISMYNNNLTEYFQLSWKLNMYSRFYEVVQLFVEQSKDNCFSMTKYREGYRYKVALGGVTTIWYH